MVELLITVVIVGVCLISILRVFSFCARTVSEAYYNTLALGILQDKMKALRLQAMLDDGVEISTTRENIALNDRDLSFRQDITAWRPKAKSEDDGSEIKPVRLCEIKLQVSWKAAGRPKSLVLKTFLPIKGLLHEF